MIAHHSVSANGVGKFVVVRPWAVMELGIRAKSGFPIVESLADRPEFSRLFDSSTKTLHSAKNILIDFVPRAERRRAVSI
jgi:hypothetical protein